jgi:hypothetical protein
MKHKETIEARLKLGHEALPSQVWLMPTLQQCMNASSDYTWARCLKPAKHEGRLPPAHFPLGEKRVDEIKGYAAEFVASW